MDWQDSLDGLQFDDHLIVHNQIYLVSAIELQSFIRDREFDLTFEIHAAKMQFVAQALLVCRFEQSRAKLTMYFDRCPDDHGGSRVLLVLDFSVAL